MTDMEKIMRSKGYHHTPRVGKSKWAFEWFTKTSRERVDVDIGVVYRDDGHGDEHAI
jgi:hypothetical protein